MIPPVANRFVAGTTLATAIERSKNLNDRNVTPILNLLGEDYQDRAPAEEDTSAYLDLIQKIASADVEACISVKPTQIGVRVSRDLFHENLGRIVDSASFEDVFVWMDMEDVTTTDATIDAFEKHVAEYSEMGVCLQANLKRTDKDLRRLMNLPGKVRLVKGAYDESPDVAYQGKERVDEAYLNHLQYLFGEWDGSIAVASHDQAMIERAIELQERHGTEFEIQMLMGVRESEQFELAGEYPIYQYVPFGDEWLRYFYRRLRERKGNLVFATRAVLPW